MIRRSIWLVCVALLLVAWPPQESSGSTGYPIQWDRAAVEYKIGNGNGATEDLALTLQSRVQLSSVDVWAVPELQPFVHVEPGHFDKIEAGVPYLVKLHFSVPPRAQEGLYTGTLQVRVASRTYAKPLPVAVRVDYGDIVIPPTTEVLSRKAAQRLSSVSSTPDGSVLVFSSVTPELTSLSVGDVLVIGVSDATPAGFIGRITDVLIGGGQVVVSTTGATLEEAITHGTISVSKQLKPSELAATAASPPGMHLQAALQATDDTGFYLDVNDIVVYDRDGNPNTSWDQIRMDGSLQFNPRFDFTLGIDGASIRHLAFHIQPH